MTDTDHPVDIMEGVIEPDEVGNVVGVDEITASEVSKTVADLLVQAMMFDMGIDWETGLLVPKQQDNTPFWLKRWKENQQGGDRQPGDYEGGHDEQPIKSRA